MTEHRGHCRCGGVSVTASSDPEVSLYCHCDDCRRSAGAPLIAAVGFQKSAISWTSKDTLESWVNGSCTRLFCRKCGSPVAQEHASAPTRTYFNTAFMAEPERYPPTAHSFATEQLGWLELTDTLPRHDRTVSINLD